MKTLFEKFQRALECYKSSPILWGISACLVIIFGLLVAEDFEHWEPFVVVFCLSLIGFVQVPTEEEHRRYREKHPDDI